MKSFRILLSASAASLVVAACDGGRGANQSADPVLSGQPVEIHAVQVGAFSAPAEARRFADSLVLTGWQAYVSQGNGSSSYRVRVLPAHDRILPQLAAAALKSSGLDAFAVVDTSVVLPAVDAVEVGAGVPAGITSRLRWVLSPNGRSLLAVVDPVGVEAEAVPNGFVLASETHDILLQRSGVWDVAPNPSWTKLAYGEAFILRSFEGDTVADSTWINVSSASGMPVDSVRFNSYAISAMGPAFAYSRPVLVSLVPVEPAIADSAEMGGSQVNPAASSVNGAASQNNSQGGAGTSALVDPAGSAEVDFPSSRPVYVSGGWRTRWRDDGSALVVGDAPIQVQDDSPPRNWLSVDTSLTKITGTLSPSRLAPVDWRLGPMLDPSTSIDLETARPLRLEGASITSSGGWIRRDGRIVGPGVAVAATRDGLYILGIVANSDTAAYASRYLPVVYRVRR